nr:hypothetical protein CTI12_AA187700 [Tanacetum cinerariifolium]
LSSGFNKSEPCYLAVTRLETDEGSSKVEVRKTIKRVLKEFKDVMPKELPKKLPPRREVHHEILGHSIPFDGPIKEEQSLDMERRVPSGVREFEESGYGRSGVETTGCDHAECLIEFNYPFISVITFETIADPT